MSILYISGSKIPEEKFAQARKCFKRLQWGSQIEREGLVGRNYEGAGMTAWRTSNQMKRISACTHAVA